VASVWLRSLGSCRPPAKQQIRKRAQLDARVGALAPPNQTTSILVPFRLRPRKLKLEAAKPLKHTVDEAAWCFRKWRGKLVSHSSASLLGNRRASNILVKLLITGNLRPKVTRFVRYISEKLCTPMFGKAACPPVPPNFSSGTGAHLHEARSSAHGTLARTRSERRAHGCTA
jgi:hypothetical protein